MVTVTYWIATLGESVRLRRTNLRGRTWLIELVEALVAFMLPIIVATVLMALMIVIIPVIAAAGWYAPF